jgi:hypothetical protein
MLQFLSHFSNSLVDKRKYLTNLMIATRIQTILIKNQIQIVHYMPGRIRLKSPLWINKASNNRLVEELKKESKILSVTYTKETGSLLIQFDKTPLIDYSLIELWLKKAEFITHHMLEERGIT